MHMLMPASLGQAALLASSSPRVSSLILVGVVSLTPREHIPGDGICDGCEDPVEFTQRGSPVIQPTRNPRQDIICISATMARQVLKQARESDVGKALDREGKPWAQGEMGRTVAGKAS